MGSYSFGRDSSKDKYGEFLIYHNDFKNNPDSIEKALIVASASWHLTDWLYTELKNKTSFNNLGDFRELIYNDCPSLRLMHDITTAAKHKTVSKPKSKLINSKKHMGDFSRDFSKDFDITYLQIEMESGRKLDFEDEIDKVKLFWENYFKNNLK